MVNHGLYPEYRHCPVCNSRFTGRSDKLYCSDQCRSTRNRVVRQQAEGPLTEVLSSLRRNRSVLVKLCSGKKTVVSRERLEALEFDPLLFTSTHVNARGQTYYFCGDYGFLPIQKDGSDFALIIRREPFATSHDPWRGILDT